jgi:hypothetical protein
MKGKHMPKKEYPAITGDRIVPLVNDIVSGKFITLETPHGIRVVLPPPPKGIGPGMTRCLEVLVSEIEDLVDRLEFQLECCKSIYICPACGGDMGAAETCTCVPSAARTATPLPVGEPETERSTDEL